MSISRREFLGTTTLGVTAGPLLAAKGDKAAHADAGAGQDRRESFHPGLRIRQPFPEIR